MLPLKVAVDIYDNIALVSFELSGELVYDDRCKYGLSRPGNTWTEQRLLASI